MSRIAGTASALLAERAQAEESSLFKSGLKNKFNIREKSEKYNI